MQVAAEQHLQDQLSKLSAANAAFNAELVHTRRAAQTAHSLGVGESIFGVCHEMPSRFARVQGVMSDVRVHEKLLCGKFRSQACSRLKSPMLLDR